MAEALPPGTDQQQGYGGDGMGMPQDGMPMAQGPSPEQQQAEAQERDISKFILETNIADSLDDEELSKIGAEAWDGWMNDRGSRLDWLESVSQAISMALLIKENKTYPWPGASNVKYPLIATAAMQFGARAYPTLVPSNGKIVKAKVIGMDPKGEKAKKGKRIETHMSFQILDEMEEWEEEMDKLLFITAIAGTCFKKTYFDQKLGRNVSKMIHPKDLIVNYYAKSIETAPRVSEEFEISKNEVLTKERSGLWLEHEYGDPTTQQSFADKDKNQIKMGHRIPSATDAATPYKFVEQHTWLDLDDDGYKEPYIVTFEQVTHKVARIVARYTQDGIKTNDKGKVICIEPWQFFTKFSFFPNPDGGFYDIGFGQLMGGINESIDTTINQLIDSGTLNNMQGGFISKALKIRAGDHRFKPGEWKQVPMTSDDLKKAILPLPSKEPSAVLMNLLQLMIQSGKELASIAEIFVGKMPGQNTPAYTTKETVEQGMKLFTAIYKRIYRSMYSEFRKLFKLNALYLNPEHEVQVLDEPISNQDYNLDDFDIMPAADPNAASMAERASKFSGVLQLMSLGQLDPAGVTRMGLNVLDMSEPEMMAVLRQGPPPPNPEQQKMQAEMQMKQQDSQMKMQEQQQDQQIKVAEATMDMQLKSLDMQMKAAEGEQKIALQRELGEMKLKFEAIKAGLAAQAQVQKTKADVQATNLKAKADVQSTNLNMKAKEAEHSQKLKQIKETAKAKPKPKGGGPK